jgi:ATP-dependent DNA helicase RecQ
MYTAGKSIEEIAAERNLATSTICGHLFTYIKSGQLDIDRFISPDKREKAMTILSATQELGAVSEILSGVLDKNEINFFLSWKRTQ